MQEDEFKKSLFEVVERLIKIRKSKNISHEKLVELSGLSRTAISYIESHKTNPTILTCMKLCEALGVKLSSLLKDVER